ncbi:hypothetical protein D1872_230740 [compost metagenome]
MQEDADPLPGQLAAVGKSIAKQHLVDLRQAHFQVMQGRFRISRLQPLQIIDFQYGRLQRRT